MIEAQLHTPFVAAAGDVELRADCRRSKTSPGHSQAPEPPRPGTSGKIPEQSYDSGAPKEKSVPRPRAQALRHQRQSGEGNR